MVGRQADGEGTAYNWASACEEEWVWPLFVALLDTEMKFSQNFFLHLRWVQWASPSLNFQCNSKIKLFFWIKICEIKLLFYFWVKIVK